MTVQLPNTSIGLRRVESTGVDAHGSPLPATPGTVSALLPGKATEQPDGTWQLALDPLLWPARVGDVAVDAGGMEWLLTSCKLIGTPALTPEEAGLGLDLDVAFIRAAGNQVTAAGTEPADPTLVGRTGATA